MPNLWAVGPDVVRSAEAPVVRWDHAHPKLHRVVIKEIGGIGEPNAGEFLVTTPCGYRGWAKQINKNVDGAPACEACLNGQPTRWRRCGIADTAVSTDG